MVDQQTTTIGCLPLARPSRSLLRLLLIVAVAFTASDALAHRSGCHRWHSCPSDHGTYVCGDLGHCSGCLDNQYCLAGQPQLAQSEPRGSKPESQQRPGVPPKDAWTCPSDAPIKGNFTTYSGERCIYHPPGGDRKSTRLNSSHLGISYAVFCLKKKKKTTKH